MNNIILDLNELRQIRIRLKDEGKKVVFTNGCFDLLHAGHVDYLHKAKSLGDVLIVALNNDDSVKRIKGVMRPITPEAERLFVISQLKCVDYVTTFSDDTPLEVIKLLLPDILVKGADWDIDKIVGKDVVERNGGSVKNIQFEFDQSTSNIISKILSFHKN